MDSLRRGGPNSYSKDRRNGEVEVDPRGRRKYRNDREEFHQGRGAPRNTLNPPEALQGNNTPLSSRNSPMREGSWNYRHTSKASYSKQQHPHASSSYKEYSEKWTENSSGSRHLMKDQPRGSGERGTKNGSPRRVEAPIQGYRTSLSRGVVHSPDSVRLQESGMGDLGVRNKEATAGQTLQGGALLPRAVGSPVLLSPSGNVTNERVTEGTSSSLSPSLSANYGEPLYSHEVLEKAASQASILPPPHIIPPSPILPGRETFTPSVSPLSVRGVSVENVETSSSPAHLNSRLSGSHSLSPGGVMRPVSPLRQDVSLQGVSTETNRPMSVGKATVTLGGSRKVETRRYGKREVDLTRGEMGTVSSFVREEETQMPPSRASLPPSPSVSAPLVSTKENSREESRFSNTGASKTSLKYSAAPLLTRKAESAPKLSIEESADDGWSDDGDGFGGDVSTVDIVGLKSKSPPADTQVSTRLVSGFTPRSTLFGAAHGRIVHSAATGNSEEDSSHFVKKNFSLTTSTSVSSTTSSQQRRVGMRSMGKGETVVTQLDSGSVDKKGDEGTLPISSTGIETVSAISGHGMENVAGEKREGEKTLHPVTETRVFMEAGKGMETSVDSEAPLSGKKSELNLVESVMPCTVSGKDGLICNKNGESLSGSATGEETAAIPLSPREDKISTVVNDDVLSRVETPSETLVSMSGVASSTVAEGEGEGGPLKFTGGVWRSHRRGLNRMDSLGRQVKALLNKLTIEKFPIIIEKLAILEEEVRQESDLVELVNLVVGKAVLEPEWSEMYADLCIVLNWRSPSLSENPQNTFRVALISKIQEEFQRLPRKLELSDEEAQGLDKAAIEQEIKKMKNHILGVVQLIGELFQRRLLAFRIVSSVIVDLVIDNENPHEHVVECFLQLICTTGYHIDQIPTLKSALDLWFGRLKELQNKDRYSKRLKCVIQDVLDLRKAGWRKKIHKERAKALSAVRGQLEKEDCIGGATHAAQYGNIVVIGKPSNTDSSKSYGTYLEEQRQRFEMRKNQKA
ncbi:putative eukaryotic translation initiation factor [Cardiosporidium cionae]|uniref:Eukaryotic translation initiation factor n=1 Tax=Cardiosporidium cionae TaxID=476202 RepID=A0ABQ7J513_9APIC|nr:putative eukaryotic translation initiation factor [Cardiosporidium cionae]|eukprot:KAF8819068.1 putative eukaryotic translation initiation factor [Cardiosporidium cionae]